MSPVPRATLEDSYIDGVSCAICGQPSLQIVHVDNLPDYVICGQCNSAFVAEEGGQRVMYGMIDESYPETRSFALRQWVQLDEVEIKAASEHPPTAPVESAVSPFTDEVIEPAPAISEEVEIAAPPPSEEVEMAAPPASEEVEMAAPPASEEIDALPAPEVAPPPDEIEAPEDSFPLPDQPLDLEIEDAEEPRSPTLKLEYSAVGEPVKAPVIPDLSEPQEPVTPAEEMAVDEPALKEEAPIDEPALEVEAPFTPGANDPPPGHRFRVVLQGPEANFPETICAHCSQTPVRGRLAIISSLPQGREVGQRKATTFNLPLCANCHKRASARSEGERNARLQAHLISALIALVTMVAALALGLNPLEEGPLGILILVILGVLGYSLPVIIILNRIGPFPISDDAAYVRSTLLVPSDIESLETAFEWRNETYAERFHQANHEITIGQIAKVKDRIRTPQS